MNLVRVEWFDTVQSADWDTADEVDIKKVHQIGWFLNEHKWSEQGAIKLADTFVI